MSTPMERAVPLTLRIAASTSKQFRSGILILAISSTCAWVILPTFTLCGSAEPFAIATARLISTGTGGVFVMNVNERSEKIVITTGIIRPSCSLLEVFALNALQNSIMLTPCGPSAVPTGGAGVALPAGICSFTEPVIFFAITKPFRYTKPTGDTIAGATLCGLFDLQEVQLHRRRAAKNRHQHAQRVALR